MTIYKEYNHTIRITGENRNDEVINLEFQSYDKSVAKLVLDLYSENGLPINLTGATVHFLLVIDENQSIEILGKIEDLPAGKVSMEIPQQIKGYNGRVKCGVYIDFSDGSKIDVKNLVFDLEKSLIDNVDYTPIKGNLFQTFDIALTEIKNYMNNVKQDTVSYADTQKAAMNNIVKDVQSTGNTAKTQIGQVLPDVQSKVSAINTELAKINANMPDLFVAYANDINGSGFSKTDNTKLYKGYSVRNSANPVAYRWERNVEDLSTGGENLIINGGFPTDTHGWTKTDNIEFYPHVHSFYFNENKTIFCVTSTGANEGLVKTNRFKVKKNTDYTLSFFGFAGSNVKDTDVTFLGRRNGESSDYSAIKNIFLNLKLSSRASTFYKMTFNTGDLDEGYIRFDHNGSTDSKVAYMFFGEVMLVEGTVARKYQPSSADLMLKSNPINSILTTLSAENPSTTLGGTWVQLGTESKFNQTIYYWQRVG